MGGGDTSETRPETEGKHLIASLEAILTPAFRYTQDNNRNISQMKVPVYQFTKSVTQALNGCLLHGQVVAVNTGSTSALLYSLKLFLSTVDNM